jgi:hypothetical protein
MMFHLYRLKNINKIGNIIIDCEKGRLLFGSGSSGGFSRRTQLHGVGLLRGSKDQGSQKNDQ